MKRTILLFAVMALAISSCKKEDKGEETSPVRKETVANKLTLVVNESQMPGVATQLLLSVQYLSNDTTGTTIDVLKAVVDGTTVINDTIRNRKEGNNYNTATQQFEKGKKYEVTIARDATILATITSK